VLDRAIKPEGGSLASHVMPSEMDRSHSQARQFNEDLYINIDMQNEPTHSQANPNMNIDTIH